MANETPSPDTPRRPSPLRRGIVALSLVAGGFVLGAGSLAVAAGDMPFHGGWHHHFRVGILQHVVRGALDNVGASTEQENKIHDIIAATYTDLSQNEDDREAMRKQALELMKAPTLDRAAIEKMRADKITEIDAKSKKIIGALLDAAGQLTPEQRAKLVDNIEERMTHGGWGGWRHEDRMDRHDGPAGGPGFEDHGHGPDDGDDHG